MALNIGDLIDKLDALPDQHQTVTFDFCGVAPTWIASSRGYYDQAALGWAPTGYSGQHNAPTVAALVTELRRAFHQPYQGWKGGTYHYKRSTPLWVDNPGDWSDTSVADVLTGGYSVVLKTQREEP